MNTRPLAIPPSRGLFRTGGASHPSIHDAVSFRAPGRKRICLFGLFGMDNYGNDGSLEAMVMFLRESWPDAEFSCVCLDPDRIEQDHRIASITIKWPGFSSPILKLCDKVALTIPQKLANWVHAIRHLRHFDVLIIPGTSTLCDYRANPFGMPYSVFRWATAAKLCGTKLFFVSTGAGPVLRRPSRWMLKYAARSAHYISFRDEVSKDFIASLGVETSRTVVYPDLAFKLPVPDAPLDGTVEPGAPTIAVGMMDYNGWHAQARRDTIIYDTYLTKMVSFVGSLLDRGYRVRLLIGEAGDKRAVSDLREMLIKEGRALAPSAAQVSEPGRLVYDPVRSLHDLMLQMREASIVVASRFHNLICALKLARPTISVGYEKKHDELLRKMGLGPFCHDIENFDPDRLVRQVEEMLLSHAVYQQQIRQKLAEAQDLLREQEQVLVTLI